MNTMEAKQRPKPAGDVTDRMESISALLAANGPELTSNYSLLLMLGQAVANYPEVVRKMRFSFLEYDRNDASGELEVKFKTILRLNDVDHPKHPPQTRLFVDTRNPIYEDDTNCGVNLVYRTSGMTPYYAMSSMAVTIGMSTVPIAGVSNSPWQTPYIDCSGAISRFPDVEGQVVLLDHISSTLGAILESE